MTPGGAGDFADGAGAFDAVDVAIGDDGNVHGAHDLGDGLPVGAAGVVLGAGAAVHGDEIAAGGFEPARKIDDGRIALLPADAHFRGKRHVDGVAHGADDGEGGLRRAQKAGAFAVVGDFWHGAAHVHVEHFCAGSNGRAARPRP